MDARLAQCLVREIQEYKLDEVVFRNRPLRYDRVAQETFLRTQMGEDWGNG